MRQCRIPVEILFDYHDERTDAAETARIQEHLASGCAECNSTLRWMQKTAQTLRAAGTVTVPQSVIERSRTLFRDRYPTRIRPAFFPNLVFDSRQRLAVAGARGAASASFQLVYRTESFDIELWQDPLEGDNWYVIGQILPSQSSPDIIPESVTLTSEAGNEITVMPNASEFHLPLVPAGSYRLTLSVPEGEIQIPDLRIGEHE